MEWTVFAPINTTHSFAFSLTWMQHEFHTILIMIRNKIHLYRQICVIKLSRWINTHACTCKLKHPKFLSFFKSRSEKDSNW